MQLRKKAEYDIISKRMNIQARVKMTQDEYYMKEALKEAEKAYSLGEVPIGAVVVRRSTDGDKIVGRGHNMTATMKDPTLHAEMIAIREAAKTLGGWRLIDCDMYVTCEPCTMCSGAILWSRIENLFMGAMDEKGGAMGSVLDVSNVEKFNHKVKVKSGILEEECSKILKEFFKELREKK